MELCTPAGWSEDRINRLVEAAPIWAVAEFYFGRLRLTRGSYVGRIISEVGADTRIEDLPRKFVCMVVDKSTGEVVALDRGPLLRSVEASIALPGIALPVTIGSTTYIDGGLGDPIRADLAIAAGATFVIRVELCRHGNINTLVRRRTAIAITRAVEWTKSLSSNSGAASARQRPVARSAIGQDADVVITPDFRGLPFNSPLGMRFAARQGAIAARQSLEMLHALRDLPFVGGETSQGIKAGGPI